MKVPWVVGRKLAVARAIAMERGRHQGKRWHQIPAGVRAAWVKEAQRVVEDWVAMGVLATFVHEYREKADQEPLAQWPAKENKRD